MKLALSWLESYCLEKPNWDIVLDKLTMAGFELESITDVAPQFSGVVVAQVISCEPHPDADKLTLCKVDVGGNELLQIICGAPNVAVGIKVPCAKVGAILPDGLIISERKMRGITSFGMLCSGKEISYPDDIDGLLILDNDAILGTDIRSYLGLDDKIVEFKITPNRGDCLSILGILREVAALANIPIVPFKEPVLEARSKDKINIVMQAPELCPNYATLVIKGVNNQVQLPSQIARWLVNSGQRSISPVVDITNFVMLGLGQPLHAFALDKVGNQLQVRLAKENEEIALLDGTVAKLTTETLVICDSQNQVAAIAGVMGGIDSGVSLHTVDIILESAFFTPETIAGKAKYYGISSDSAYRFERGVDPSLQVAALKYAAQLITQYCGGIVGEVNVVGRELSLKQIHLPYALVNRSLGINLPPSTIDECLQKLQFTIIDNSSKELLLQVPSFRFDINLVEDLIEEVVRVYGYDNVVPIMPVVSQDMLPINESELKINRMKSLLVDLGYNEIIGYAFLEEKFESLYGNKNLSPIRVQNPIAGFSVMRTSLLADLVKVFIHNTNRGCKALKLFELANVFYGEDINSQPLKLAGLIYGESVAHWSAQIRVADFFDLKNHVELLLAGIDQVTFVACADYPVLHSGRCAKIYYQELELGIIGQLHPELSKELGVSELPYYFELNLDNVLQVKSVTRFAPISKFPKVARDLAFVVAETIPAGLIMQAVKDACITNLRDVSIFDVYQGANLPNGYKSIALNFVFQTEKTLTEDEINGYLSTIMELVTTKFTAKLR